MAEAAREHADENDWWTSKSNIQAIRDFAFLQGLIVKATDDPSDCSVVNVSVTLTPSKFPAELFHFAHNIQRSINTLIDAVSRDDQFLNSVLERVVKTDDFTRRLFTIHKQVSKVKKQKCVLGIHRSDYLLDYNPSVDPSLSLKQVEVNTIAASYFGLNGHDRLSEFHRYVNRRYCKSEGPLDIPTNTCLSSVNDGIACAWKHYGKQSSNVLFVVRPGEPNVYDHRPLEIDLWNRYGIESIRKTLIELSLETVLGPQGELLVSGVEVAVVYYRAGYSPVHYPSENEWTARLLLERSQAICCPSATYQLVGTKKVQQALAVDGMLERFISDPMAVKQLRSTFAGLYSLDIGEAGERNVEMALRGPEKFVVKPQREGGGNNIYGKDVATLLQRLGSSTEREAYILMDKINPPSQLGFILRPSVDDELHPIPLISELGVFGVFVRQGDTVLLNTDTGHILRSKPATVNEGGVSVGVAALDSPVLVSSSDFIKTVCNRQ